MKTTDINEYLETIIKMITAIALFDTTISPRIKKIVIRLLLKKKIDNNLIKPILPTFLFDLLY